ncbi:UxaA family hydrolase [uncultured Shimia sp.]|uniref:UxaA family hydrolase n=1 Tax=uncultured Shimia sp. TaxID=573152 RepID=UPI002632EA47|nr:UxaA family hydrolase [uncultured Shimia sp.]
MTAMMAWPRKDGRKGIRNVVLVAYLVECAHHVCKQIARPFPDGDVQVVGFSGCFPSDYGQDMMAALCTHPNVGAVQLVSLGCENFKKTQLAEVIRASGRPVDIITIQDVGGTGPAVKAGQDWIKLTHAQIMAQPKVEMAVSELVIGTICGGSDATSGITGNPAAGVAFDMLVQAGATCIFEETGELIGCEHVMADRVADEALRPAIIASVDKAAKYYEAMGYGSFSNGNATGGLSTIEEKSLGAYAKSGQSKIAGILRPAQTAPAGGLYLLDVVPDGPPKYGYPNINDNAEIIELISCGAHVVIFVTGRGSVVGSAISPVLKVCANPETYDRMSGDMDVNAGRILDGGTTLQDVGAEIVQKLVALGQGQTTASEDLGHVEFVLTYKTAAPAEPGCHPN